MKIAYKSKTIIELWKSSLLLGKSNFKKIYLLFLISGVINYLPVFYYNVDDKFNLIKLHPHFCFTIIITSVLVSCFLSASIYCLIYNADIKNKKSFAEICKAGVIHTPKIFLITVLSLLMLFFGTILFILPGIYLFFLLLLAPVIAVIQEKSALDSIRESFLIIRGNWWKTFTALFVPLCVVMIISICVYASLKVVLINLHVPEIIIHRVVAFVQYFLLAPMIGIFVCPLYVEIYKDLWEKKYPSSKRGKIISLC